MGETGPESLDGSSIKPVSSLRSPFEQMSSVNPSIGTPSSSLSLSGSFTNDTDVKSSIIDASGPHRQTKHFSSIKNIKDINQLKDVDLNSHKIIENPLLSPKSRQTKYPSHPFPTINSVPPPPPLVNRRTSLHTQTATSKSPEISGSKEFSPETHKVPRRPPTPSQVPGRPPRAIAPKPPSPPPPRRSCEHRRTHLHRPEKPEIKISPISLVTRNPNLSTEMQGSTLSIEENVSPFITPPSANGSSVDFPPSSLLHSPLPGLLELDNESKEQNYKQRSHAHVNVDSFDTNNTIQGQILPQNTGTQKPALPARSSALTNQSKIRPTIKPSQRSVSIVGAGSETSRYKVGNNLLQSNITPRTRKNSVTADRIMNKATESIWPSLEQFPDSSFSNRRPPYFKKGARDISTKYETRIMDVCGEYVCTSGHITRVWSLNDGEMIASFAHTEGVKITSVAFKPAVDLSNEGFHLWLGNNIGDILEVDILSQNLVETRANVHARRDVIKIFRHFNDMWTLDSGGTLLLWAADAKGTLRSKNFTQSFRIPKGHTFSIVVSNELWLATGRDLRVFMPTSDASIQFQVLQSPLSQPNTGDITSGTTITAHPDKIFFGHADGKISIYSTQNYTCLSVVTVSIYKITALAGIAGNLWAGFSTGMMYVYDIQDSPWVIKKDWSAHHGPVIKLISDPSSCWSLGRAQVVTLGQDNMLRLWDGLLEDDYVESQMHYQESDFCESNNIRALVMTWNAGASSPFALQQRDQDANFFRDLIRGSDSPDILVFGFQELVDLEDKKVVTKSFFKSKRKDSSVQEHMSHQYREWRDFLTRCLDDYMPRKELYHLLHTASLVGLFTCVFVRAPLIDRIRSLNSGEIKRGLGGLHGNKGALVIRFLVDDTSICFVNCHLAAGQSGTKDRNADITAILETSVFPSVSDRSMRIDSYIGGGDGTMILDHEICILNGDLNYRIDTMSRDTVINAIRVENITKLLERDQLLASKKKNPWFKLRAFQELPISFAPTYKYDIGTDTYDTSDKKRSPAWCDRILYRGRNRIEQLNYQRHEVRVSDHRPVSGSFQINVKKIFPQKRAMKWDEVRKQRLRRKEILTNEAILEYLTNIIGYDATISQGMISKRRSRQNDTATEAK